MKITMCFGTFDNFHPGHQNYLEQASKYSLPLLVVIARDETVKAIKGKLAQESEKTRQQKVNRKLKELKIVGQAVLGDRQDKWRVLREYRPRIICLGYDQPVDLTKLESLINEENFSCEIKRLKPYQPNRYKSSYCQE